MGQSVLYPKYRSRTIRGIPAPDTGYWRHSLLWPFEPCCGWPADAPRALREEQNLYPLIVMTGVGWRYSERLTYLGLTFKLLKPFITRQIAGCGQF